MRIHLKLLGSAGLAAGIIVLIVQSRDVAGDTPDSQASDPSPAPAVPAEPAAADPDPSLQYDLGPHAIPYEELSAEEQQNLDRMAATTASSQPEESHLVFERAAQQAAERARAETAAAQLGLTGLEDQGVVP